MNRFKILVIDDDQAILDLVADVLEAEAYTVLRASSGRMGIGLATSEHPDLILVDLMMPEMDGVAVVQALKADPSTRRVPVVALTGAMSSVAEPLMRAGCIGYIPKPFDLDTFCRLIAEFIKVTVARRPGSA